MILYKLGAWENANPQAVNKAIRNHEIAQYLHTFSITFGIFKGLVTVFSLFDGTRTLMEMIMEVIADMKAFMVMLILSGYWLTVCFMKVKTVNKNVLKDRDFSILYGIEIAWSFANGEFDAPKT